MPPLVNLTRQNAEQQLNALGLNLNIQIEERKDDIYTEGYVIQTDPASGSALTSGRNCYPYRFARPGCRTDRGSDACW